MRQKEIDRLPLDDEGRVDGFQFGGRQRAIAEWREKKEEQEFKRLCRRLKLNKQARERFRTNPIWRAHRRKYMADYMRQRWNSDPKFREKYIKLGRAWKQRQQKVRTCRNCGAQWVNLNGTRLPGRRDKPQIYYCSKKCRIRFKNRELSVARMKSGFWRTPEAREKNRRWRRNRRTSIMRPVESASRS